MSDDTPAEPPKPAPPKRAPRRRATPAKAAAAPKRARTRKPVDGDTAGAASEATSPAQAAAAPAARRRKAAAPKAKAAVPKRAAAPKPATVATAPADGTRPRRTRAKPATPAVAPPDPVAAEPLVEAVAAETPPVEPPIAPTPAPPAADAARHAAHADGLAFGESPVDLPGAARDEGSGLRWASGILAIASPLLLLFNSHAIDNWARQLPVNGWTGPVIDAATQWHATMQRIGFAAPVDAGRAGWKRLKGGQDDR